MLTARLVTDAPSAAELDLLLSGVAEVQIATVDAGVAGELVRHILTPLLVEALTPTASTDPTVECQGPLVRVYIQRPSEDT